MRWFVLKTLVVAVCMAGTPSTLCFIAAQEAGAFVIIVDSVSFPRAVGPRLDGLLGNTSVNHGSAKGILRELSVGPVASVQGSRRSPLR
jgi:hypothetical protein